MKLVVLVAAIVLFLVTVYIGTDPRRYTYVASVVDKVGLLRHAQSPKMVLIGGSSLAFGIDSGRIEEHFDYDVVNTGVHGGFKAPFMLSLVEPDLEQGDLVVIALEYGLLHRHAPPGEALSVALASFPEGLEHIDLRDLHRSTFLKQVQRRFWEEVGLIHPSPPPVYNRRGFNEHGDLVTHLDEATRDSLKDVSGIDFSGAVHPHISALLNSFYNRCVERGVTVVVTFSPLPAETVAAVGFTAEDADRWGAMFASSVLPTVISTPSTYFIPRDQFFDTVNHLNGRGRQTRTSLLINDLEQYGLTPRL